MKSEESRDLFYWDLIVELEDRRQEIESQLSNATDEVFDEYCLIWELLGVLYGGLTRSEGK